MNKVVILQVNMRGFLEREGERERDKLLSMFRILEIKFMLREIMELIRWR